MREILFRAKDIDTKKWRFGQYIHLHKTTHCFKEDNNANNDIHQIVFEEMTDWGLPNRHSRADIDVNTLGQFTGLYDKNGKRIFEGDIVVSRFANDKICSIGDIQFDCGVFGVEWTISKLNKSMVGVFGQKHNLRRLDDDCIDGIEVIGNIYDNPELIKENEDENYN